MTHDLLTWTDEGLTARAGGFTIDPLRPTEVAVITHAHADHARSGMGTYYAAAEGVSLLRHRLGGDAVIQGIDYGVTFRLGALEVSFHPAGHIRGSAQVRVSDGHAVWVVSGDYKRADDRTTRPFEVVPCDVFVTECTFGLPIHRWPEPDAVHAQIAAAWDEAAALGRPLAVFAYALGKAQRILAGLPPRDRPIFLHGAVDALTAIYRADGIQLPPTFGASAADENLSGALVIAPPSAAGSPWMRRFPQAITAFASGWMQIRGHRRRRGVARGFVLSDHADFDALVRTVMETRARRVLCTHGRALALSRHLRELGLDALPLQAPPREAGDDG